MEMSKDPQAIKAISKKVGNYGWIIGEAGNNQRDTLMSFITEDSLKNLIKFSNDALNIPAVYKEKLVK